MCSMSRLIAKRLDEKKSLYKQIMYLILLINEHTGWLKSFESKNERMCIF